MNFPSLFLAALAASFGAGCSISVSTGPASAADLTPSHIAPPPPAPQAATTTPAPIPASPTASAPTPGATEPTSPAPAPAGGGSSADPGRPWQAGSGASQPAQQVGRPTPSPGSGHAQDPTPGPEQVGRPTPSAKPKKKRRPEFVWHGPFVLSEDAAEAAGQPPNEKVKGPKKPPSGAQR